MSKTLEDQSTLVRDLNKQKLKSIEKNNQSLENMCIND